MKSSPSDLPLSGALENIEQSLCIATEKGIVIIAGCSHPPMAHIIGAASEFGKVYGIIGGGLHGNAFEAVVAQTVAGCRQV